jgi:hypothetical protein
VGTWDDVSSNLPPAREIIALVASEFNPLRALVMAGTPTSDVQAYQTTDGGQSWQLAGVPPVPGRTAAPDLPECTTIPCPQVLSGPRRILSFGITFADPNFPLSNAERWYVGTSAGVLLSDTGGNTWWDPIEVPLTPIHEIDTFSGAAALATGGRGVWIYDNIFELYDPYFVDCDLWCLLRFPLPQPDPWASWLVALSDDILSEIVEPRSGRVFRRGDQPFGDSDFLVTPGAAVMAHADDPVTVQIDALPDRARPIKLKSGWNAVGIPSVLTTSLGAVADAAAQGITIESIVEGALPAAGRSNHIRDFTLIPTAAYWVFVCGDGGLWTPGAGSPAGL